MSERGDHNKARKTSSDSSDDADATLVNLNKTHENNKKVDCNKKNQDLMNFKRQRPNIFSKLQGWPIFIRNYKKYDKRKNLNFNSESSDEGDNKEEVSSKLKKKTKKCYENECINPIETIILI